MAYTKVTTTLADTLNQNTTGSAATLTTARTIGGTSFDGSADIAVALAATATSLASARTIGGTSFDGTGNIAVGLAATATALATARTIGGTSFDGTANIVPGTVTVTDSTANTNFPVVFHNESNGLLDDTGALRYNPSTGELLVPKLTVAGTTTTVDTVTMNAANAIIFEGATADAYETTLSIVDPTSSDKTQYLLNQTGYIPLLAAVTTTTITSTPAELNLLDALDRGSILYGNSSGVTTVLGQGSADQVLTSDGTDIAWQDASSFDADAAQVFNESGADVDFRVESNDSANMLFVDGGNNKVLVSATNTASVTNAATALAARAFEVNGNSGEGSDNLSIFAMADGTGNYGIEVSNSAHTAQYDLLLNPINGGNVGIGAAPSNKLHIRDTGTTTNGLYIEGDQTSGHTSYLYTNSVHTGNVLRAYMDGASSTGAAIYAHTDGSGAAIEAHTTGVDYKVGRFYDGSYNVSLGRDAIAAYSGDTEASLFLGRGAQPTVFNGDVSVPNKIFHTGDTDTYIKFDTNSLALWSGGQSTMVQTSGVNYMLSVSPTAPSGSSERSYIYHNNASNTSLHIGTQYANDAAVIHFETRVTPRMEIDGAGKVKIGDLADDGANAGTDNWLQVTADDAVNYFRIGSNNSTAGTDVGLEFASGPNGPNGGGYVQSSIKLAASSTSSSQVLNFRLVDNTSIKLFLNNSGFNGTHASTSDIALKENIADLSNGTTMLKALRPRTFDWKTDEEYAGVGTGQTGFIAQEVEAVSDKLISGEEGTKGIYTMGLLTLAIKTIQELEARITALES